MRERLQKLIARAGVCSRRTAETLLTAGRVTVNGVAAQLGDKADADTDVIAIDGTAIAFAEPSVYLMLNKPAGSGMSWAAPPPLNWWQAAAHGYFPWAGWTRTARACCCSPMTAR